MNSSTKLPAWNEMALLDIVTIKSGQVDPRSPAYRNLPLIAPDHLASHTGRLLKKESAATQGAISGKYLVKPGDVIYSKIRPYLQKAYKCDFDALCSADMYPLTPRPGVDASFVLHSILSHDFTKFATSVSARSGIPKINRAELSEYLLAVPPLHEQRAIGRALDDADDLIVTLERTIAKKQAIKQGMMQQLLTGKTRLPGFRDPWLEVTFEDLAAPSKERTHPKNVSPDTKLVELEHIGTGSGRLTTHSTAAEAVSLKTVFRPGDVLFGKLRAYLRKYWIADTGGICSTEIWALRTKGDTDSSFVRYLVETERFIEVASSGYGTHMPRSDWGVVRKLPVLIPPRLEQQAISRALRDADAEIGLLYNRLEKAVAVKECMMQQLLTGRTRLPARGAQHE